MLRATKGVWDVGTADAAVAMMAQRMRAADSMMTTREDVVGCDVVFI